MTMTMVEVMARTMVEVAMMMQVMTKKTMMRQAMTKESVMMKEMTMKRMKKTMAKKTINLHMKQRAERESGGRMSNPY